MDRGPGLASRWQGAVSDELYNSRGSGQNVIGLSRSLYGHFCE